MGKRIVEEEQQGKERAAYGEGLLKALSIELINEFGKGFSYANLRNFRQFYLTYPDEQICYTVCSKLTWSHNRLIMRVENENARKYYLIEAAQQNWSVRVLDRNINTFYYQRLLSSQNKAEALQHGQTFEKLQPEDFIKDPYVFEFLNMDMYVRIFDDLKKQADDNPTIGIILCAETDHTIVKYSVLKENEQLFATKYMPFLPTEAELIAEIERERKRLSNSLNQNVTD
jgi:predicted nuclease of restriction endonuclease-like (RecB) superfamily